MQRLSMRIISLQICQIHQNNTHKLLVYIGAFYKMNYEFSALSGKFYYIFSWDKKYASYDYVIVHKANVIKAKSYLLKILDKVAEFYGKTIFNKLFFSNFMELFVVTVNCNYSVFRI